MKRFALFALLLLVSLLARAAAPSVAAGGNFSLFLTREGKVLAAGSDAAG